MFKYSKVKWLHTSSNTNTSLRLIRAMIIIRETNSAEVNVVAALAIIGSINSSICMIIK